MSGDTVISRCGSFRVRLQVFSHPLHLLSFMELVIIEWYHAQVPEIFVEDWFLGRICVQIQIEVGI